MSSHQRKAPLGAILQQAGLVSADNIDKALRQQRESTEERRIGEILASQGYINSQTADFFVESWSTAIEETPKKPLGYYFKQARLLDDRQVKLILERQQQTKLKFGEQAVAEGFLNQTTIDFFLKFLSDEPKVQLEKTARYPKSTVQSAPQIEDSFYKIKLRLLNLEDREDYYKIVLERILFWTEGQSFLTQKTFKLIKEHQNKIIAGKEAQQVDRLVKTRIIKNWRNGIAGKHLQAIEERAIENQQIQPAKLIELYQKALTTKIVLDDSPEQQELIKIGLIARQKGYLVVANRIYKSVFDFIWTREKLSELAGAHSQIAVAGEKSLRKLSTIANKEKKRLPLKNLLLLLTLIVLLLVFFDNLTKRIKVKKAFETGNQFLQQKSYDEAIAQYNKLLNIDSNYFQAWTNRGYALAGLQKYEEMRESCSTATIINPTAVYAWNCQGEALHNLKREAAAIDAFDRAIALDKTDPIFLINKSESLKSLGKEELSLITIARAIEVLEKIEATEGKNAISSEFAVALTFLGNGYRKQEKYEPAIFSYNRALEYSPNYFPAQIGKGIILNRVQRYLEAQEVFQDILKNEGISTIRQAQTWFYLGKSLCQSGQNAQSITAFDRAIELDPDYQAAKQARQNCE